MSDTTFSPEYAPKDIRLCVAKLRKALTLALNENPVQGKWCADLLNETSDVALKYECYVERI